MWAEIEATPDSQSQFVVTLPQVVSKQGVWERRVVRGRRVATADEATYSRWSNQYGGMKPEEAKRLEAAGG